MINKEFLDKISAEFISFDDMGYYSIEVSEFIFIFISFNSGLPLVELSLLDDINECLTELKHIEHDYQLKNLIELLSGKKIEVL